MALSVKHAFTSAIADSGNASLIQPSNWNAEHTLLATDGKLLGASGSTTVGEITVGSGMSLSSGTLSLDADLVTIAGLTAASDSFMQAKSSAWAARTVSQVIVDLVTGITEYDNGKTSSGTLTPTPGSSPMQIYTNGGAHTLAPGSTVGNYIMTITNDSSAGAITTSGWTKVAGSSFTTTNGNKFRCMASIGAGGSLLIVQAMQ